ncbi:unnamed protein product, partial [Taenia asiatica]|uniref:Zgc: n=1 Tax=Taenia asiatica TaxID=60517 RepID=A0A0R3VZM4_TAEAS
YAEDSVPATTQRIPPPQDKDKSACRDCVIYAVDPRQFSERDIRVTLESLQPHQTLLIAVIVLGEEDESTKMDWLMKFLQDLGGYNSHLLATMPMKWRLFCIKHRDPGYIGWSDLFKWGCYDVFSKRLENGRIDDSARSA